MWRQRPRPAPGEALTRARHSARSPLLAVSTLLPGLARRHGAAVAYRPMLLGGVFTMLYGVGWIVATGSSTCTGP